MLSGQAQGSRNQLPAGPDARRPGVAPGSVRTGLQSRVPALVAGTSARCWDSRPAGLPRPPPVPAPRAARAVLGPCHSGAASALPGHAHGSAAPVALRPVPCAPRRPSSSQALEQRRGCPEAPGSGFSRPQDLPGCSVRPSGCCSAARLPPPRGRRGRECRQNPRIGVRLVGVDPSSPQTVFGSFLGRSCPMFEPFLPREDGLLAASWGLCLVRGGDGACAGLPSYPSEDVLMFQGYA